MKSNRNIKARSWAAGWSLLMVSVVGGCASAQVGSDQAAMPAELIGIWDIAVSDCIGQGNPDSDTRLVITQAGIENYEQTFKPTQASSVYGLAAPKTASATLPHGLASRIFFANPMKKITTPDAKRAATCSRSRNCSASVL